MKKTLSIASIVILLFCTNIFAQEKSNSCQYKDTIFTYKNKQYDVREIIPLVNSIIDCRIVGKHLVLDGHINPMHGGYFIFNTETLKFDKDIVGSNLIFHSNDISTAIYIDFNKIYNYKGEQIASLPEDGLWELNYSTDGKQIIAIDRENPNKKPLYFSIKNKQIK